MTGPTAPGEQKEHKAVLRGVYGDLCLFLRQIIGKTLCQWCRRHRFKYCKSAKIVYLMLYRSTYVRMLQAQYVTSTSQPFQVIAIDRGMPSKSTPSITSPVHTCNDQAPVSAVKQTEANTKQQPSTGMVYENMTSEVDVMYKTQHLRV